MIIFYNISFWHNVAKTIVVVWKKSPEFNKYPWIFDQRKILTKILVR